MDSIVILKAQAYDTLSQIEMLQRRLQELNQKILAEMQKGHEDGSQE